MKLLWLFALVPVHAMVGVPDDLQKHYDLKGKTKFHCLSDPKVVIDASQVNDGVCDCPDGSDEVLTGACSDLSSFYCRNEGFIPRFISGSKVNDGVCDCCDCSDETLSPEISWRGMTCEEVNKEYEWMVKNELDTYKEGIQALNKYVNLQEQDDAPRRNNEEIEEEITAVEKEIDSSVERLERESKYYNDQLQLKDPLGHSFTERFDIDDIVKRVQNSFETVVVNVANTFQQLNGILDKLSREYKRSLNDKVVIRNVDAYEKFIKSKEFDPVTINGEVEQELSEQLTEYFERDIPRLFLDKETKERDAEYVINKFDFVKSLIEGKNSYSNQILHKCIKRLTEFMSMISSGYNVNFQDPGVLAAVDAYKQFMAEHGALVSKTDDFKLDGKLQKDLNELLSWVKKHAAAILENNGNGDGEGVDQDVEQLKQLRSQVKSHKKELAKLEQRHKALRGELANNKANPDDDRSKFLRALSQMNYDHNGCHESIVDQFAYTMCFAPAAADDYSHIMGGIKQSERTGSNEVSLGTFDESLVHELSPQEAQQQYEARLEGIYPQLTLFPHLRNETVAMTGEETHSYLYGNLYEMTQPLQLEFIRGTKCWMGPRRTTTVTLRCAKEFKILSVAEPNVCSYKITLAGPIGCKPGYEPLK